MASAAKAPEPRDHHASGSGRWRRSDSWKYHAQISGDPDRGYSRSADTRRYSTVPIWATLFAHQTGDSTAAHRIRIIGIVIGLIGISLIVGIESISDFGNFAALAQVLIASVSYAWAVNMITRKAPGVSGLAINGIAMTISSVIFAPFALMSRPESMPSLDVTLATLGLGILCSGMAFWIFFLVLAEIGPARASLVVYPNTAVAVVLGIIILSEPITLAILIGLPLVLIGSYFASRRPSTQPIPA